MASRQGVAQYTANQGDTIFNAPFYVYDVAYLSVYLTPAGHPANDSANLLIYNVQYIGESLPLGGNIILLTPANLGDIITILYNVDNAIVFPQYPLCSQVDPVADSSLPVLPPSCMWAKSSDGSKIIATAVPAGTNVPTVPGTAATNNVVKFGNTTGAPITLQNSNTTLTSITLSSGKYDNVSGINNLTIKGTMAIGNTAPVAGYMLDVTGAVLVTTIESQAAIILDDVSGTYKTFITAPQEFSSNITYVLPPTLTTSPGALLASDLSGNLSWLPQNSITQLGEVTQGIWNAGSITSSGDITSTGVISGTGATFATNTNTGIVTTNGITFIDTETPPNTATFKSPPTLGVSATYTMPASMGSTGDVLMMFNEGADGAFLNWVAPLTYNAANRTQVTAEIPAGLYVDPTQLKYHNGIAKAWVRFHMNSGVVSAIISSSYNLTTGTPPSGITYPINRIATGIYDIYFANNFASGTSYTMHGTGYLATNPIISVVQYPRCNGTNGQDPQPGYCRIALLDQSGNLTDGINLITTPPMLPPDVYVVFFGSLA
jgi:hypothetical protein